MITQSTTPVPSLQAKKEPISLRISPLPVASL